MGCKKMCGEWRQKKEKRKNGPGKRCGGMRKKKNGCRGRSGG